MNTHSCYAGRCDLLLCILLWIGVAASGCSGRPAPLEVPAYNAGAIANAAIAEYDANSDGAIDAEEIKSVPALRNRPDAPGPQVDADGDGRITAEEINRRVQAWIDADVGRMSVSCQVMLDGKPLKGAQVTFTPESFMGGVTRGASGETNAGGICVPAVDAEKGQAPRERGLQSGFYKVEITHPSISIPAKYNSATTLGEEVAPDLLQAFFTYTLKS